ncbi:MAG: hypothetical protein OXU77_14595 [Gammaproteobacteria bacterium]|nr:hypothetical protein [Gammaproteobacteria bacterium]MDE0440998.1 hypothetical protein [Gammaproteobacteria bacterium]
MDAEVRAWEPPAKLGDRHAHALDGADTTGDVLDLDEDAQARLREVANGGANEWSGFFADRASGRLIAWLRVLTLAEETIPGCETGAKSPVIVLARLLRERGDYPAELTAWIRSVSTNRFLPYGSLMDRLGG